jgi:hypothetical protein
VKRIASELARAVLFRRSPHHREITMKKTGKNKLVLNRETIAPLQSHDLDDVAGGITTTTSTTTISVSVTVQGCNSASKDPSGIPFSVTGPNSVTLGNSNQQWNSVSASASQGK